MIADIVSNIKLLTNTSKFYASDFEYFKRMPANVFLLDKNCRYVSLNENSCELVGMSEEKIIGKNDFYFVEKKLWKKEQASSFINDDMFVIKYGLPKINIEEPKLHDVSGQVRYFLSNRLPVFDKNNEISGVLGISFDITDRKILELAGLI